MPTYEYACSACNHAWEELQRISEEPLDTCPKCGKKSAQRLISQGNFILKGGGWYTTGGYGAPEKPRSETATSASPAPKSTAPAAPAKAEPAAAAPATPAATPAADTKPTPSSGS